MKWVVVAAWVVMAGIGGSFAGKFEQGQKNEQSSFLPGQRRVGQGARADEALPVRATTRRSWSCTEPTDGRLTRDDLRKVTGDKQALDDNPRSATGGFAGRIVSEDRTTALLVAPVRPRARRTASSARLTGCAPRPTGASRPDIEAKVTGPAGFSRTQSRFSPGINGTLLLGTAALVFVAAASSSTAAHLLAHPVARGGLRRVTAARHRLAASRSSA